MNKHLHQHPLIPTSKGQFLTKDTIYEASVHEMYTFCKNNCLISLWSYLWTEWYSDVKWKLWARSSCEDKISILKTTMFIEGHWKTIKRDFLYKFFRPRIDLVYVLTKKVIIHQQRKLQQILIGREKPEWIKDLKSEWKKLSKQPINNTYITNVDQWICGCSYYLTSRFNICKHLVHQRGSVTPEFFNHIKRNWWPPFLVEENLLLSANNNSNSLYENLSTIDESIEEDDGIFDDLIDTTKKVIALLEEQKLAGNLKWCRAAKKSFDPLTKLIEDVEQYRRKRTMPLTWKGHTDSTRYLQ